MDALTSSKNTKKKKVTINMIRCNFCSKIFTDRSSLSKHQATHSTDCPYECSICDYAGKTQQYLRRHIRVKHGAKREFSCDVCGKTFHFGCKLKDHMRVHTGEKPYKCAECGKAFNASYSLNTHKLIHTGAKPYQCVFCVYACRDSSTLRKHQARHTGTEKQYKCKMCDISCKSKAILKLHVAEKHLDVDVRKFECNACGKKFKIKQNLSLHIQVVHDRLRTTKCDVCGVLLSNRANLAAHMRTHVDERPYLCTVELCERRFKDTSSLRKHTLSHYPERQLACDICRKRFMSKNHLERHLNTHRAKVKKVECGHCGVRFLSKKYLTNHIQRKHGKREKKYICDICGHVTTNKPALVMHIKYGHKRMYRTKCKLCERKFQRASFLKKHYWRVHKFDYKIPKRQKKKPKKPVIIVKEEPRDEFKDEDQFNLIPKEEPLDDENVLLADLAAASGDQQLTAVPADVFEELIDAMVAGPGRVVRPRLDHRRIKRAESGKYLIDKKSEAQAKKKVKELLEKRKQKTAIASLERTRRKYNRLMRKALKRSSTKVSDRPEIKYYNNNKETANSMVDKKHNTIEHKDVKTIDKTKEVLDNVDEVTRQTVKQKKDKTEINNLLVEDFSVDHAAIEDIDQEILVKTNEAIANVDKTASKTEDSSKIRKECSVNVVVEEFSTDHDAIYNIDQDILDKTRKLTSNIAQTASNNNDNVTLEEAWSNDLLLKDISNDQVDDINQKLAEKTNQVISNQDQVDNQNLEEIVDSVKDKDTGETKGRNRKLKLNIHQCYVCFKLYETKEKLLDHCKEHFDLSNIRTLKKCPLCVYATELSVTKHLKKAHDIDIKIPYGKFKDDSQHDILKSKYYYEVGDEIINKVEIIPSVKNLNRHECKKIDKANRDNKNKAITKNKLVKKGNEWIVMSEKIKIKDCLIPKFDEVANLNPKGGYIERMKELYRIAKKKGVKMLFPCDSCDKVCQTLSALKLHGRKHQVNPKPFKPKVWKHKLKANNNSNPGPSGAKTKNKKSNEVKIQTAINSQNLDLPTLDRRTKQAQNESYIEANRKSKPKPIKNKHRCRKELKEFYERNIKGGDIEFWQFLKIYNKMGRENVNDFPDLEKTREFGCHSNVPVGNTEETDRVRSKDEIINNDVNNKKTIKLTFKRGKLSKTAIEKRRNEIKRRLREKIKRQELEVEIIGKDK